MSPKKIDLALLASQNMLERGLQPNFPEKELLELKEINQPAPWPKEAEDLRQLCWCSIDNDDSLDLDQLTYGEQGSDGKITLWVAIADVDAIVKKNSPMLT